MFRFSLFCQCALLLACSGAVGGGDDTSSPDAQVSGAPDAGPVSDPPDAMPTMGLGIAAVDRYVVLGDSLSVGAFPNLLHQKLVARFPGIERIQRAESGSEIDNVLDHQIPGLAAYAGPVLVTLTIGGNDFKSSPAQVMNESLSTAAANQFEQDLQSAVELLEAKYSGPLYVLITNIHDPTDDEEQVYDRSGLDGDVCDLLFLIEDLNMGPTAISNLGYWNTKHTAVANANTSAHLADLHDLFLGHALNAKIPSIMHYHPEDPSMWLNPDCAHPNQRGHTEIADMLWRLIE